MNSPSIIARLTQGQGALTPLDQAVYLRELHVSIRQAYEELGASLQAALAVAVDTDLEGAAKAFGVPPAMLVQMAETPDFPDVVLLIEGIQAARRLRDLPIDAICDVRDALDITGASKADAVEIARLLSRVADQAPMDSDIWSEATPRERMTFHRAVTYARSLTGDS
ncbi:hypothetical protein ACFHYQ_06290 [Sphaerimonospora cavernae]|uniref:DUF222 domain-containing protein n=1 Tax=Sphaerimonospora cavernae TaxID=1740611 RepID=A0ABV6U0C7_9ACTN